MINLYLKYHDVKCFWCGKEMTQRQDTFKRQAANYGHSCCKRCFGKEPSFRTAQKAREDSRSHPHTDETKKLLSELRIGVPSWNNGLDKTDERVKKYANALQKAKKE